MTDNICFATLGLGLLHFKLQLAEMTKLLEEAMAKVALLPEAEQERIGRDVLSHVEKLRRLRTELDRGIASLDRGEGKALDMDEFILQAHRRHGRA